jgi:hypothetical protein
MSRDKPFSSRRLDGANQSAFIAGGPEVSPGASAAS